MFVSHFPFSQPNVRTHTMTQSPLMRSTNMHVIYENPFIRALYNMVRQRFKWEIGGDIPFPLHNRIQYVFAANLNSTIRNHIRNRILSLFLSRSLWLSYSLHSPCICFCIPTLYRHRKINKQTQYINFITPLCSMPN